MRRLSAVLAALVLSALPAAPHARAQRAAQPHAFLYGAWTGGLFPPPSQVTAETCLAAPSVIFMRDVVLRATLTSVTYVQRSIETVRGTGHGVEFRFIHGAEGFGCPDPDALSVTRISTNQISFPDCADFPFPLVRCPAG
ncbi:MAG TPA: hypothetical protein VFA03_03590 [Acetobacteraceae bacterium]|nr:hypothetical protein [Acetobacteraceae bacterium]